MSANKIKKLMSDKEVEYVDLRFTDPKGKLQHLTMDSTVAVSYTHLTLPTNREV